MNLGWAFSGALLILLLGIAAGWETRSQVVSEECESFGAFTKGSVTYLCMDRRRVK